ncbi:MAG: ATP-binding cassette domain-containing protein [Bacillota bacterium]|nr:ATP-binding cassette domain-containing protein [Bacillota bacterium]
MEELIKIENLSKSFTTHHLDKTINPIKDLSLTVNKGDFLGIVGKSGSGKSTIIKCIYRTYTTSSGHIWYESKDFGRVDLSSLEERKIIQLRKNEIGYVSQFLNIMPRTTSLDLVINSCLETGASYAEAEKIAKETLRHFDLDEELWDSYPNTFSGGEKLRLNISVAIVKKPRLLLLDEPTASLDNLSKIKVRESIEKLKAEGTTMIGIFHDIEFMEGLTDKIFYLGENRMEVEN